MKKVFSVAKFFTTPTFRHVTQHEVDEDYSFESLTSKGPAYINEPHKLCGQECFGDTETG